MKRAGRAIVFELRDMIGPSDCVVRVDGRPARAVPLPFYDGLLARIRSAWEVVCGRAYPVAWPESGDLEEALGVISGTQANVQIIRTSAALAEKVIPNKEALDQFYRNVTGMDPNESRSRQG